MGLLYRALDGTYAYHDSGMREYHQRPIQKYMRVRHFVCRAGKACSRKFRWKITENIIVLLQFQYFSIIISCSYVFPNVQTTTKLSAKGSISLYCLRIISRVYTGCTMYKCIFCPTVFSKNTQYCFGFYSLCIYVSAFFLFS